MRIIVLLSIFAFATPALAGEMPAMRSGMWEFTRKAPMDPFTNPGQLGTISKKECIRDMKQVFTKQKGMLAKMCTFSEPTKSGNSYTTTSSCDIPEGHTKLSTKNVTTVNGDTAYESRIETDGTAAGKHAKWTETLSAKRIGECGQ